MTVFKPSKVGGIEVKNRVIRSATHESVAIKGGFVGLEMQEMYRSLSKGGVGLIITGFMAFSSTDNFSPKTILIDDDDKLEGLKSLSDIAHEHGTKIVAQISHSGSQLTHPPSGEVFAPSDVKDPVSGITPKPLNKDQINLLIKEFGAAALRAKKAGFDGVQIHGAHGYLLSKFLSPVYNKRNDEYGGSLENNSRLIIEILHEIKSVCGSDYPVWIKLNSSDFSKEEGGFSEEDFIATSKLLKENGIDAIEVSGGTMAGGHYSPCRPKKHEAYHLEFADRLKNNVDISVIVVGGFRKFSLVENVFATTDIDAVSMSRALIREPDLIGRWEKGDFDDAKCIACNGCFNPNGTRCFFTLEGEEKKAQQEIMQLFSAIRSN